MVASLIVLKVIFYRPPVKEKSRKLITPRAVK